MLVMLRGLRWLILVLRWLILGVPVFRVLLLLRLFPIRRVRLLGWPGPCRLTLYLISVSIPAVILLLVSLGVPELLCELFVF